MTDVATFNLSALADRLIGEGRKTVLAQSIRNVVQIRSLEIDLLLARDACDALAYSLDTPMNQPPDYRNATETALLWNIVLLYARATKTTSTERKQFDPRSKFTSDELTVHEELCDLRDHAIAHFGYGGSYVGNWVREVAVIEIDNDGSFRAATLSRRQVVDRALLARARAQIGRALQVIDAQCQRRMKAVTKALVDDAELDPAAAFAEIAAHPLNTSLFLGNKGQADAMRGTTGEARGGFDH